MARHRLRYAYVWGDPVNLSDPTGLAADAQSPIMGRTIFYDGSLVKVVENHADGSTTYQVYNLEVPTEQEAWNDYQTALQKERGIIERAGQAMEAALNWTREKAKAIGSAVVENFKDRFLPYNQRNDPSGLSEEIDNGMRKSAQEGGERVGELLHDAAVDGLETYGGAKMAGAAVGAVVRIGGKALQVSAKVSTDMARRGWTAEQIAEAMQKGQRVHAIDKATGEAATRYIHPQNRDNPLS